MKGTFIAFGIAVSVATIFGACDGRSPATPNPLPSSQPIYSLTGVVTEPVAVPVEGAVVAVLDGPHKGKSTTTDRAGTYALIGVDGGFTIQVTKDGYASAAKGVTVTQSLSLDVEITPLGLGNISGNWTVTFEPSSGCPSPLIGNVRTYRASIVQQGAQLTIALSGATFATPPQLTGTIHDLNVSIDLPSGCDFYCYYGPSSPPAVIENLGGNQFLAIWGQITARVGRTSITGDLSGEFALMNSARPPFEILASCGSVQHRVTFTR
jgi:Carboxypeptidase regulatory-like domain